MENTNVEVTETTEEMKEKFRKDYELIKKQKELKELNEVRKEVLEAKTSAFKENENKDEITELLDERCKSFTSSDEIKKLSDDRIKELFTTEDGEEIGVDINFETEAQKITFMRDYLELIFTSNKSLEEIDKSIAEYSSMVSDSQEELNKVFEDFISETVTYRDNIKRLAEKEEDPIKKRRFEEMVDAFDVIPVLNRYLSVLKNLPKPYNSYNDWKDFKRSHEIFSKYAKRKEALQLQSDLRKFRLFEEKFLPEEYHKYKDLFLFLVIKLFTYNDKPRKEIEGLFSAQFTVMLQELYKGTLDENNKEQIINVAKEFIDSVTK